MNISSGNYGIIIKGLNIAPKKSPQELYMSFTYNFSDIKMTFKNEIRCAVREYPCPHT